MILGIGHLALNVIDMEKSLLFYCGVLGLNKAFEINDQNGNPFIVYLKICDSQFIELFYGGEKIEQNMPKKPAGFAHICLEVEDIYATAKQLNEKGIILDVEPRKGRDKNYQCWAKDPDGNRIEFIQMSADSLQRNS